MDSEDQQVGQQARSDETDRDKRGDEHHDGTQWSCNVGAKDSRTLCIVALMSTSPGIGQRERVIRVEDGQNERLMALPRQSCKTRQTLPQSIVNVPWAPRPASATKPDASHQVAPRVAVWTCADLTEASCAPPCTALRQKQASMMSGEASCGRREVLVHIAEQRLLHLAHEHRTRITFVHFP